MVFLFMTTPTPPKTQKPTRCIVPYQPHHKAAFKALNEAWLTTFFIIEPYDTNVLSDPDTYILNPGGAIFMAEVSDDTDAAPTTAGTCSMMPHAPGVYELTKLAVDQNYQGLGLGRQLMQTCLNWAKTHGLTHVVLFSNSKLTPATQLYESLGFTYFTPPVDITNKYERCNIAMTYTVI